MFPVLNKKLAGKPRNRDKRLKEKYINRSINIPDIDVIRHRF